ncbi:DUF4815 domain-containing protein [Pseudovibrio brasiliensis]|uniref:DUF4815 domain-containing protein n=1 Tax=Pseudovibrio brasiliensis TaxID=1898042 RepID=A0ABX8AVX3_9HYPH|nr:DUF4815 domain-containing protein [Pseudovibrio brasiliensis]QUS59209.1 DUF4815 domain-containing protein [Pseudovibrio brasiliensis]
MDFKHPLVPDAYTRTPVRLNDSEVVFPEERFLTGADLNDGFGIARRQSERIGNTVSRDGDRKSGASIEVDQENNRLLLGEGTVYAAGDVRPVDSAVLENVNLDGDLVVGVRLISTVITPEDDPTLTGLKPGSEAEGEKGAVRIAKRLVWGYAGDGADGELYPVYNLVNGTPLDQTPPAEMSEVAQVVGAFDVGANGNYIADGCRVTAIGKDAGELIFSIAAGTGNINGFRRPREHALRLEVMEEWDSFQIDGEQHTYTVEPNEQQELKLHYGPIDELVNIQLEKEITEDVVRGQILNGSDALQNDSLKEIVQIKQGGTTFVKGTDYQLTADKVDWSLAGNEPAVGSSYTVKYRYRDAVEPITQTAHEITLTGGRKGGEVVVIYKRKLPRVDLICLDQAGSAVYVKGLSSARPIAPVAPVNLLKLATVYNDFDGLPRIENDGTRKITYDKLWEVIRLLNGTRDLTALNRLQLDIHDKEPAAKRGIYVDPFVDDRWRDQGELQNAATRNGMLSLPLEVTIHDLKNTGVEMLPYQIENVINQPLSTTCKLVNRFANHEPFPARMTLDPAQDFWTDVQEAWESDVTHRVFGPQASSTNEQQVVGTSQENAEFLRAVDIIVNLEGFGGGEILDRILFDNVDMTPAQKLSADDDGNLTLTLNIPAKKHAAGEKLIEAFGVGGSEAFARFVGEGTVTTQTMQRVTTLVVVPPPPPPPQVITVTRWRTRNRDPRGQTFSLPAGNRHVAQVQLQFCKIGNPKVPVVVELRATNGAGYPTDEIIAQAVVDMSKVELNKFTACPFPSLPYLLSTREYAFIAITPDNEHSISAAVLGEFDEKNQSFLGVNPYTVGTEIESSNNSTYIPVHGSDLTSAVDAAKFTQTTKRVELGEIELDRCSDLMIAAAVDAPESGCSVTFEITRADGTKIQTAAYDGVQFDDWVKEKVSIAAILQGTETASPRLFPGVQVRAGKLASSADYVGRLFKTGNASRFPVRVKRTLPNGATAKIFLKNSSGTFVEAPYKTGEVLDEAGTVDATYELSQNLGSHTAVKITVTGNPSARPILEDLRAVATI